MSRDEFKSLCVTNFRSEHRFNQFLALNALLQRLLRFDIPCEVWIDGSYLTEKQVPQDIDLSVMIDEAAFDQLTTEAKDFVEEISSLAGKYEEHIDLSVCIVFPEGSEERTFDPPEQYAELWGMGHDDRHLKGFAVLRLPDGP